MKIKSVLCYETGPSHNTTQYPDAYGTVTISKLNNTRCTVTFAVKKASKVYTGGYAYDSTPKWSGWRETAQIDSGTWSPSVYGTDARGTWTPSIIDCRWTLIGTKMTLWIKFSGTLSGATGPIQIGGLPRTPKHNMGAGPISTCYEMEASAFGNGGTQYALDITKSGAKVYTSAINGKQISVAGNFEYEV